MKLAIIVANVGAAVHVGGEVERKVKLFDMPDEVADYIRRHGDKFMTVSLAVSDDDEVKP